MALTPNRYLTPSVETNLRDQQHAARLFTDDQFRLAPKHKYLFHMSFSINPAALQNINLAQRHRNEINMLVKSVDLPKFTMTVETANQYNRKKNIQVIHKPEPLNVKFHDDNMGLINQLWQNYYSYYYADPSAASTSGAYNRNATRSSDFILSSYGLDNKSTVPFFNYVKIYQMARHEFVCYTLQNPIITSWAHGSTQYAGSELNEKAMTLAYEAVSYSQGTVTAGDPEGFGLDHYDQVPSPLVGTSGLQNASPSFTDSAVAPNNAAEFISNMAQQLNTYLNTQPLANPNSDLVNLSKTFVQGVSGLQGFQFPTGLPVVASDVALPRKL